MTSLHRKAVSVQRISCLIALLILCQTTHTDLCASDRPTIEIQATNSGSYVSSVAFSPDGKQILASTYDEKVKVYDVASGRELLEVVGFLAAYSPGGKRIVSAVDFRHLTIWDAVSGKAQLSWKAHQRRLISDVAFDPKGKRVLSGGWDNWVKCWDSATGKELVAVQQWKGTPRAVAWAPDGKRWVVGLMGNLATSVDVWDTETQEVTTRYTGHTGPVRGVLAVAFSPDGKRIVSGGFDRRVRVWDAKTGQEQLVLPGHNPTVSSVAFSPDGHWVISGGHDNAVKVWDSTTGKQVYTFQTEDGGRQLVRCIAVNADGSRVASGHEDGTLRIWKLDNTATDSLHKPEDH